MLLVEVVRRAVCLPLALAGFSVINVDLDVLLPPPFSCQAVFITIEKKKTPISGDCRVLSGHSLYTLQRKGEKTHANNATHSVPHFF